MKLSQHPYILAIHGSGERISPERIEAIRKIKKENPKANQKTITWLSFESKYAVGVALKDFSL